MSKGILFDRMRKHFMAKRLVAYSDDGRWITIGSQPTKGGGKSGGSKVFVKNGKIEKGAASLKGKSLSKVDSGKSDKERRKGFENTFLKMARAQEAKRSQKKAGQKQEKSAQSEKKTVEQKADKEKSSSKKPDWKKRPDGGYEGVNFSLGKASLYKKGKSWFLDYNGKTKKMPAKGTFDNAENIINKENAAEVAKIGEKLSQIKSNLKNIKARAGIKEPRRIGGAPKVESKTEMSTPKVQDKTESARPGRRDKKSIDPKKAVSEAKKHLESKSQAVSKPKNIAEMLREGNPRKFNRVAKAFKNRKLTAKDFKTKAGIEKVAKENRALMAALRKSRPKMTNKKKPTTPTTKDSKPADFSIKPSDFRTPEGRAKIARANKSLMDKMKAGSSKLTREGRANIEKRVGEERELIEKSFEKDKAKLQKAMKKLARSK